MPDIVTLIRARAQERPGARRSHGPRANKKHGVGTTGSAETSRPSLRDGVTIYTRSSRGTAFLPPSPAVRHRQLGISTGMPEPRDFIVASGSFVRTEDPRCDPMRPPHPAPDVRDDREAPPQRDGMREFKHDFG